jgi:bromodomain-containing protein 7/9
VLSSIPGQGAPRRRPGNTAESGGAKKEITLSETLEPDGRLPGAKQGLGAFPPGSDLAETMLRLKIQSMFTMLYYPSLCVREAHSLVERRHITKKERLRIEKIGRPYLADGSLEYAVSKDAISLSSISSYSIDSG